MKVSFFTTACLITVEPTDDIQKAVGSSSGIRIHGVSADNGWNHALSEKFPSFL